jgi:cysteine sulfinate desulfinase/cysteine desulfurase-like protein
LATLNNAFVLQQSEQLENRIKREFGSNPEAQARQAIRLAFGRQATEEEIASGAELIQEAGLFQLCRIILNTNEFIYID